MLQIIRSSSSRWCGRCHFWYIWGDEASPLKQGADAIIHGLSRVLRKIEIRAHSQTVHWLHRISLLLKSARALYDAGVDVVPLDQVQSVLLVFIAGVGVPQVTAIYDAAAVVHEDMVKQYRPMDGIKYSGDSIKTLAGGNAVMLGSIILLGTDSSGGLKSSKDMDSRHTAVWAQIAAMKKVQATVFQVLS